LAAVGDQEFGDLQQEIAIVGITAARIQIFDAEQPINDIAAVR
jgi:hypothetical protein